MELDNNTPPYRHGRVPGRIEPIEPNPTVKCQYCEGPDGYAYDTLHASIAVSAEALGAAARKRYLRVAVLLEDMPASESLLRTLWGGEEEDVFVNLHAWTRRPVHLISTLPV
jgi:hypothetical protein